MSCVYRKPANKLILLCSSPACLDGNVAAAERTKEKAPPRAGLKCCRRLPPTGAIRRFQFNALSTRDPSMFWQVDGLGISIRSASYSGGSVGAPAGAGGALCSEGAGSEAAGGALCSSGACSDCAGGALCSSGACSDCAGGALCSGSILSSFATLHLPLSAFHEHSVFAVQSASLSPLQIFASWFFDPSSQALRRTTETAAITTRFNMTLFLYR